MGPMDYAITYCLLPYIYSFNYKLFYPLLPLTDAP